MFPLLDGYRAIAALLVLTTHVAFTTGESFSPVVGPLLGRMDFGVTLFFVLSGFLLYRPWARSAMAASSPPRLGTYALRRSGRILPAYWAMVVFTILVLPEIQPVPWDFWVVHLGLLHIYIPGFTLEGLTQTWSLATEVSFYVLLPLLAWLAGRRHRGDPSRSSKSQLWVIAGLATLTWVFIIGRSTLFDGGTGLSGLWIISHLDWFAVGMTAAVVSTRLERPDPPRWMNRVVDLARETPICLGAAAAIYVIAATPLGGPIDLVDGTGTQIAVKHAAFAIIAIFYLLPGFFGRWDAGSTWSRFLQHPVVVYLGTISYGIFLWHLVLLRLIVDVFNLSIFGGGFIPVLIATVLVSVLAATASWFVLERPVQRWTHRRGNATGRQRLPSPAP